MAVLNPAAPAGYRFNADGVLVPEEIARKREVWPKADVKKIDGATRILKSRELLFQFACKTCGPRTKMELVRDPTTGQRILRCNCTDRLLSGAI